MGDTTNWRDWANHPEAVTAIWPRVMASGMPPASCLALLGTCLRTRNAVLLEAPRAKRTVQLRTQQPTGFPLLLLKQGGRTQPTTLALLNQPSTTPATAPAAQPPVDPQAASTTAQHILSHSALLGCITRLDLQGVVVDSPLLQAMQGLPALTHLHLTNIHLPPMAPRELTYQADSLPQHVHTLHIALHPWADNTGRELARLLAEFLLLDTITDLTILGVLAALTVSLALEAVTARGREARALHKLSPPHSRLYRRQFMKLQHVTPALEELQAFELDTWAAEDEEEGVGQEEVSWHTLRVHDLDVSSCGYLPLGGTQSLDIHVSGSLNIGDEIPGLPASIRHLTSQQTRPVCLVGRGRDGGAFNWEGSTKLVSGLSVLQLSKAPVRELTISTNRRVRFPNLLLALQPLPALTHLSLIPDTWDTGGSTHDQLLARLPLHVTHVCLDSGRCNTYTLALFKRMVVAVSTVPGRQAQPLHLCVVGAGPGSDVWEAVDECRARGHMGVVMEQEWDGPAH